MNQMSNDTPESLSLPKPQPAAPRGEARPNQQIGAEQTQQGSSGEKMNAARPETQSRPAAPLPAAPAHVQQQTAHQATNASTAAASTDLTADDVDLIEKEWVTKAKNIVEQTRNDPHQQNKQISRVKADYIKKRYNRDIKVSES